MTTRTKFMEMLRSGGINVSTQGVVKGKDNEVYGYIRATDIKTSNGDYISFENITTLEINEYDGTVTLFDAQGSEVAMLSKAEEIPEAKGVYSVDRMPIMDSELNDMFPILYPDAYDKFYYDVLLEREMVDMSVFGMEGGIVPIDDNVENIYLDHVERRLKQAGFTGRPPGVDIRRRVLSLQAHKHQRNRFREWVESHPWDGKPRIATWFQKVFNASAPPLRDIDKEQGTGLEDEYLAKVAEAWFIGGIKRMYSPAQHEIVPVLIGGQGVGKSTGLRYTAGLDEWFAETTINISVPGGIAQFLDSVRGKIVVELAESTTIRGSDQEALKAFISKREDQYRKPYARFEQKFPRHFIMAASTNIANLFTDITGNRRYYPIYCDKMSKKDFKSNRSKKDVEQVWAEALYLYRESLENCNEDHVWYLRSTWKPAVIMQSYSTQDNMAISTIEEWLDDPNGKYVKVGSKVTKREIIIDCFCLDPTRPLPKDYVNSFKAWANGTRCWVKKTERINGKQERLCWVRVKEPGNTFVYDDDEIEKEIDELSAEYYDSPEIVTIVRERAKKYNLKEYDVFPTDDLSDDIILKMGYAGYLALDYPKKGKHTLINIP